MAKNGRKYDVVLYGASGFTGELTARYLAQNAPKGFKWALAGRQKNKLEKIQTHVYQTNNLFKDLPLIIVDSSDQKSIDDMTSSTNVICTTVGPYSLYGTPLVESCVKNGTHYCDLTGETFWVRDIIAKYQDQAKKNSVKIVHCCGFDSIPFDMGSYMAASHLWQKYGEKCQSAKVLNGRASGGVSGGTIYSAILAVQAERKKRTGPHSLDATPGTVTLRRKEEVDFPLATYDSDRKKYLVPSIMATVNTKIVRRSKSLFETEPGLQSMNPYDKDFWFNEAQEVNSKAIAVVVVGVMMVVAGVFAVLAQFNLGRKIINKILPNPGHGPSEETMRNGYYHGTVVATSTSGRKVFGQVKCPTDPGYMCTSLMLGESALCLALDMDKLPATYGILTPSSAFGSVLLDRLRAAGMTFQISEESK